jgi:L-asparaginase
MTKVGLISTGGTIAMGARHPFDWVDYGDSGIVHDMEVLLPQFQNLLPGITLVSQSFRSLGSVSISWSDWVELLSTANAMVEKTPDLAGIVVTHGTATLEETVFFLHLTWPHACPIILVGALGNMRAALAAACEPALRDLGAIAVMNSTVFHAPDVTKGANFALNAFESPVGPIGQVDAAGQVNIVRRPAAHYRPKFSPVSIPPRVDIMMSYSGSDGCAVEAFRAAGAKAIVVAALPPGRCASGERAALVKAAKEGVTVIFASRASRDRVPVQDYNVADGILAAGCLAPHKARILAMLALSAEYTAEALQKALLDAL